MWEVATLMGDRVYSDAVVRNQAAFYLGGQWLYHWAQRYAVSAPPRQTPKSGRPPQLPPPGGLQRPTGDWH
ncbi:hypothetical protein ACQRIU_002146 [Beauveria bassiana]